MILGWLEILLGLWGAMAAGNELMRVYSGQYNMVGMLSLGLLFVAFLFLGLVLSFFLILLGIGLWQMKAFALRYSLFFLLIIALLDICLIVANYYGLIAKAWIPTQVLLLLFCCIYLYFLQRPNIKAQFK